jgi:hypothetical protein
MNPEFWIIYGPLDSEGAGYVCTCIHTHRQDIHLFAWHARFSMPSVLRAFHFQHHVSCDLMEYLVRVPGLGMGGDVQ